MANYRRTVLLLLILATLVASIPAQDQEEQIDNIPAVLSGLRANAVEGEVVYARENAKFDVEADLELKQADTLRTGANGRVEFLLQPGNLLRAGPNTECQFADDRYDRLKFLLNKGTLTFELIKNDWEDTSDFFESLKQGFELIRVITPNAEVFLTQPGIFRINTADGRTELIVRRGEVRAKLGYAFASLASILTAFAIWNGTKAWLCEPHSLIQGHAIWHVLGAVAAFFLYRYYASEEVGDSATSEPPDAGVGSVGRGAIS